MHEESVITRTVRTAPGVLGPGHLGELTQTIDFALVDAVLEETRTCERRRRLLPSRVVVYFVLALALFERCSRARGHPPRRVTGKRQTPTSFTGTPTFWSVECATILC